MADCQWDSFVTIGMDGPVVSTSTQATRKFVSLMQGWMVCLRVAWFQEIPGSLSSVGIDFSQWSETQGINSENGAV